MAFRSSLPPLPASVMAVATLHQSAQVKCPGWKIHQLGSSPGSALPNPAYFFVSVIVRTENKNVYRFICFDCETALVARVLRATTKKRSSIFLRKKVHPGYLAGGFF